MALSNRQLELIEYMLANPILPETVCARNCSIPNSTYFNWKKKGEFTKELKRRLKEQWEDSERLAVESMVSLCREGNFNATKYILDNLGYSTPLEVKGLTQNIEINIGE